MLKLAQALAFCARELTAQVPFPEVQEQLLCGLLVDSLRDGSRVELRHERDELRVRLSALEQVSSEAPMKLGVEMLGGELGENGQKSAVGHAARERVPLEPLACPEEEPRRDR